MSGLCGHHPGTKQGHVSLWSKLVGESKSEILVVVVLVPALRKAPKSPTIVELQTFRVSIRKSGWGRNIGISKCSTSDWPVDAAERPLGEFSLTFLR